MALQVQESYRDAEAWEQAERGDAEGDRLLRPSFLGICAPRSGTHWLRNNLDGHAGLRIVGENLWFYDLCLPYHHFTRYLFRGRINGDLTPMYCLLTRSDILRVRRLLPECKLVVLLRDPVSRAWSHIKHMQRHGEAVFAEGQSDLFKAACCPYAVIHGDYLGTLSRWLSVYPRASLLIRFFEDIARRPAELLEEIMHHIGIERPAAPPHNLAAIHNGDPSGRTCPPVMEMFLQQIYRARTEQLLNRFGLTPPPEWERTLNGKKAYDLDYGTYDDDAIDGVKVQILRKWLP